MILRVRSGAMTVKQGARALGVSRKTYYQWEERALKAMALALENRVAGRPYVSTDEEKETLRQRIRELEKKLDLAEEALEVKQLLAAYEEFRDRGAKKKRADRQEAIRRILEIKEQVLKSRFSWFEVYCDFALCVKGNPVAGEIQSQDVVSETRTRAMRHWGWIRAGVGWMVIRCGLNFKRFRLA